MIPKKIHYCWFGGNPLPDLAIKCIESWKRILPDYEIIEWNENNFDLDLYPYTRQAYDAKKFAYVTDVVRLYVLKEIGGIYLDSDVEVIKPLDAFLHHAAFSGFESNNYVPTGIMASEKDGAWTKEMLDYYDNKKFFDELGNPILETNVKVITRLMTDKGFVMNNTFQEIKGYMTFYPYDFFCPKNWSTGIIQLTPNSHCIHHFAGSWLPPMTKNGVFKKKIRRFFFKLFGKEKYEWSYNLYKRLRGIED